VGSSYQAINGPGFGTGLHGDYSTSRPSSNHRGGVNILFVSGAGRFVRNELAYPVYIALMTTKGAEAREPGTTNPSGPLVRQPPKYTVDSL
jgi:hypothetical protein